MGAIALLFDLVLLGPSLVVIVAIAIAATRGWPRNAGRRGYAIASVSFALLSAGLCLYMWISRDRLNDLVIPVWPLIILMVTAAGGAVGCLLGAGLYRTSDRPCT